LIETETVKLGKPDWQRGGKEDLSWKLQNCQCKLRWGLF